jgi:hypothetical protein
MVSSFSFFCGKADYFFEEIFDRRCRNNMASHLNAFAYGPSSGLEW